MITYDLERTCKRK